MADSTTVINACDVVIELGDELDVAVDISGVANEFSLDFNKKLGEYKTFGSNGWFKRLECGKDASLELKIVYSMAADEGFDLLKQWYFNGSGPRTIAIHLPDKEIGSDSYSGSYFLENFSFSGKADEAGPIMVSATLKPTGAVGYAVVAA